MKKYTFPEEQRAILEKLQMPLAVYQFIDRRVVTLILSDGFLELSGYPDRETATFDMDRDMYKGTHPDDKARISEAALHFATEDSGYNVVYRSRKVGASEYSVIHAFGRHVTTKDGVRLAYIWYADEGMYSEDNPKRRARLNAYLNNTLYENSILKASRYDFLTGLPNITYFFELVDSARDSVIAGGGRPTLLFFDLCGLKFYNHKYGFAEGDRLLQSFSKLLAREFGSDNCCHVGQDHFAAFAEGEGLEDRIRRLFDSMSDVYIDAPPLRVGIYFDEDDDTVPVSVACDRAKLACDLNRGATESVFCYYSHDLRDRIVKKQYIIENLDRALKERWIEAYFQPIIRSVNGKVCDEEALSRWNDPVKGMLSPSEFIPPLEETGLIYKLDLYLLERVLEKINIQKASGIHIVPHSINLSRADFDACDVVEEIRRRVDEAGVERDKISIEITESVIGSNLEYMKEQITRFRDLGFKVWMDDFGNAYSSLDVLQSIQFDLIKFDMNFLKKLDESESAKIILTELMKMAASLGLDTICEGVEKESHLRFLKEIGCSKLQGYYFCRPISFEELNERYRTGGQIGYEDPAEEEYYKALGGVNLYDISVIAGDDAESFSNSFDMLPMGIIEVNGDMTRFARSNKSYRDFIKRFLGFDLSIEGTDFTKYDASFMNNIYKTCCERGIRSFYDENMPDGSVVHSFARRIGVNPVTGTIAVAIAVLSITGANEGATYASIARALAADYYNIYYVDLKTDKFIEYSSPVGGEGLAMERHGEGFFDECIAAGDRIYSADRAAFFAVFSKEKVIEELDRHGTFSTTYRITDTGTPTYVNMKITRMMKGDDHIIIGISFVDSQMKKKETVDELKKDRDALARVKALSDDYMSLYTIDPVTESYVQYSATSEYERLNFAKEGESFFRQGLEDGKKVVHPDDLPYYLEQFNKENILSEIAAHGSFIMNYRLILDGVPKSVGLKVALIHEDGKDKLVAGVKYWKDRHHNESNS